MRRRSRSMSARSACSRARSTTCARAARSTRPASSCGAELGGPSWAGHWAALMAYRERDRIRGSVVHGVGIHGYFQPEWQKKGLATREHLFDLFPARASVYGVSNLDEFLTY